MRSLAALVVLVVARDAYAYKPASPVRHDVFSNNHEFVLDVNPDTEILTVYKNDKRDSALWSFKSSVWQEEHFLSNDGQVVAIVAWRFVQVDSLAEEMCIEFWNRDGKSKEYSFAEICPHPSRIWFEPAPIGSFWRKWYTEVKADGNTLRVRTTDEFEYYFSLSNGRIMNRKRIAPPLWAYWVLAALAAGGFILWIQLKRRRQRRNDSQSHR